MFKTFRRRLRELLTTKTRSSRRAKRVAAEPLEALENRLCLTNLNFLDDGRVIFGGGAGDNALTISVVGDTYTFADPNETINFAGPNVPTTRSANGNTVTFLATSTPNASIDRFFINTNAGTDTVTISSFRPGAEGIEIANTGSADTVTITGDIGTNAMPVATFGVLINAAQLNLGAEINTNNLQAIVNAPVTLTANSTIDSGTGALDVNGAIDGAFSLTANGGFTTLDGAIGGGTALAGLTVSGETTGVRVQAVEVDGAVSLIGNQVLTQGALTGDGSGALSIRQFTNGSNLTVDFNDSNEVTGFSQINLGNANTGRLQFLNDGDGAVSGTGSFRPGSSIVLTGDEVEVGESIDQQANTLTVNVDTMLVWAGQGSAIGTGAVTINKINAGGTLTIQGKMGAGKQQWGANALTVNAVGSTVDFEGEVSTNLASFTAVAAALDFSGVPFGAAVGAGGNVTLTATTISLGGGINSLTGSILVNGAVTLTNAALLKAAAGQDITINGTVTSAANHRVIVRGAAGGLNSVSLNGAVTGVGSFQIDGTAASTINLGNVTATNMIIRGTTINVGGNLTVADHGAGLPEGNLHLVGGVTLTANAQLNYTANTLGRSVRVDGTITGGGNNLTINTGIGTLVLAGAVTGVADMDITTTGFNFVTSPITVTGTFNWDSNGTAVFVLQDITAGSAPVFTVTPILLNGATLNP